MSITSGCSLISMKLNLMHLKSVLQRALSSLLEFNHIIFTYAIELGVTVLKLTANV